MKTEDMFQSMNWGKTIGYLKRRQKEQYIKQKKMRLSGKFNIELMRTFLKGLRKELRTD